MSIFYCVMVILPNDVVITCYCVMVTIVHVINFYCAMVILPLCLPFPISMHNELIIHPQWPDIMISDPATRGIWCDVQVHIINAVTCTRGFQITHERTPWFICALITRTPALLCHIAHQTKYPTCNTVKPVTRGHLSCRDTFWVSPRRRFYCIKNMQ